LSSLTATRLGYISGREGNGFGKHIVSSELCGKSTKENVEIFNKGK
jgi:hypothetical protein